MNRFLWLLAAVLWVSPAAAQDHTDHSSPVAHECKCGPDCQCNPCACGEYIAEGPNLIYNYACEPTTVTVKDGEWFDSRTWSAGVPDGEDVFKINHVVRIGFEGGSGDLNGDGLLDKNDYRDWDGEVASIRLFLDDFFDVIETGAATAKDGMVGKRGTLSLAPGASLSVGTLHVLGMFRTEGDVVLRDTPFDYVKDAMQWGHGVLVHSGGQWVGRGGKVSSENPDGVRGHVPFLHSGTGDLYGMEFADLGRTEIGPLDNTQLEEDGITPKHVGTNQMARYGGPHFHHCWGLPGLPADVPRWRVSHCRIHDGSKWGLTIHQSHFGIAEHNEIWNCGGAGIALEDGNEYANTVADNTVWDIVGDGKGQQGHNNGLTVQDVGTGTLADPFRTLGSHGNEGAGIWARGASNHIVRNTVRNCRFGYSEWNRFNDGRKRPVNPGDTPGQYIPLVAGTQLGHSFSGNVAQGCTTAAAIQGMVGPHIIDKFVTTDCDNGIDFSYNEEITMVECELTGKGSGYPMQPGFTNELNFINCFVSKWKSPVQIWGRGSITGGDFDSVLISYKFVGTGQQTLVIDGATIRQLSSRVGDLNKNVDYGTINDVFVLNFNGVLGDNFQLFFAEQADDYIPKNLTDGNPRRTTPEPGLTNEQLESKYGWRFGGRGIPEGATQRAGITGWVAPIPVDLVPYKITERVISTTPTTITIRTKTDEPARVRTEYVGGTAKVGGDVKLGFWPPMVLPLPEFSLEQEVTLTGLKQDTTYSIRQTGTDVSGNVGGDNRAAGINYIPVTARTAK
jgi:hypothetical protein